MIYLMRPRRTQGTSLVFRKVISRCSALALGRLQTCVHPSSRRPDYKI